MDTTGAVQISNRQVRSLDGQRTKRINHSNNERLWWNVVGEDSKNERAEEV